MKGAALLCFLVLAGAWTIHARELHQNALTEAAPAAIVPAGSAAATTAPAALPAAAAPAAVPAAQPAAVAVAPAAAAPVPVAAAAPVPVAIAPAKPAAAAAPAEVAPAAAAPAKPAAKPASTWVQKEGQVPVPETVLAEQEEPETKQTALPPANAWSVTDDSADAPKDTTSIFSDPRAAPKPPVDAAEEPATAQSALGGNMPTAVEGPTLVTNLGPSQYNDPSPPPSGDTLGSAPDLGSGGDMGSFSEPSTLGAMPTGGDNNVFSGGDGGELPNTYVPSPGNALGANDLLAKMTIDNTQQELAPFGDVFRGAFANITSTQPRNVFFYQPRTVPTASGQPQLQLALLFKNTGTVDRSRQQQALVNPDIVKGVVNQMKKYSIRILPNSITTSSAVNDGGAASGMGLGAGVGMGGMGMGGMGMNGMSMNGTGLGLPGMGMNTSAPAPVESPAPAQSSSAAAAAGLLLPALAAVAAALL